MSDSSAWSARRILTDLCDAEKRKKILVAFWKNADEHARHAAILQLARALRFREETIRKAPADKKAEWMISRISAPEMHEALEMGLMAYHTTAVRPMLASFLDAWNIPHVDGTIEVDDYRAPSQQEVRDAVAKNRQQFDLRDITIYLAAAGLLMGGDWREATWPVVDELKGELAA